MKKLLTATLVACALCAPQIARADEVKTAQAPPLLASPAKLGLASVTPFIVGLKEPQGLALDGTGDVIVCDYGAGEVLRFNAAGEKKAVLATGLKGPSQIVGREYFTNQSDENGMTKTENSWIVSERKANRVVILHKDQKVSAIGGEVIEPMGLFSGVNNWFRPNSLYVVAHTTSKIYRFDKTEWKLVYEAPGEDGDTGRYGLRCLAGDGDTMFVSDEVNGDILMISPGGRIAKFASGIEDPSGLAVRGDWVYVCDESNGGRLWKLDKNGVKTLAAEGLGRPRNVLFLDDQTALVSDRDGRVLKLSWMN